MQTSAGNPAMDSCPRPRTPWGVDEVRRPRARSPGRLSGRAGGPAKQPPGSGTAPSGQTHRPQFTAPAPLEIRVRTAIGGCPDLGQFGSALRDNYDLYHVLS